MSPKRNNLRFTDFFNEFKNLNIIKDLEDKIELWSYNKLDEVNRISNKIKNKILNNGIN